MNGYDQAVTVLRLREIKLTHHMVLCTFVQTLVEILPCRSSCVALHGSLAKLVRRVQRCIFCPTHFSKFQNNVEAAPGPLVGLLA